MTSRYCMKMLLRKCIKCNNPFSYLGKVFAVSGLMVMPRNVCDNCQLVKKKEREEKYKKERSKRNARG